MLWSNSSSSNYSDRSDTKVAKCNEVALHDGDTKVGTVNFDTETKF